MLYFFLAFIYKCIASEEAVFNMDYAPDLPVMENDIQYCCGFKYVIQSGAYQFSYRWDGVIPVLKGPTSIVMTIHDGLNEEQINKYSKICMACIRIMSYVKVVAVFIDENFSGNQNPFVKVEGNDNVPILQPMCLRDASGELNLVVMVEEISLDRYLFVIEGGGDLTNTAVFMKLVTSEDGITEMVDTTIEPRKWVHVGTIVTLGNATYDGTPILPAELKAPIISE